MAAPAILAESVEKLLGSRLLSSQIAHGELTVEIDRSNIVEACRELRNGMDTRFDQLIDICGVDYLQYGFENGGTGRTERRYAAVYHLLSIEHNHRLRIRAYLESELPVIDSVTAVWPAADWFEREAFDLFGIIFEGHPDLRRILTDYGFIGHPFRKDFPLSGYVEMRYDPEKGRVVYEPVTIEPRTLVPRTIREDTFGDRDS